MSISTLNQSFLAAKTQFLPPCAHCGFVVPTLRHKYCSAACKQKAYRRRNGSVTSRLEVTANLPPWAKAFLAELKAEFAAAAPIPARAAAAEAAPPPADKIEIKKASGGRGEWNGLISMALLNGCLETLRPEVYEYAVTSGRIPKSMIKASPTAAGGAALVAASGPKKMNVPKLPDPVFED